MVDELTIQNLLAGRNRPSGESAGEKDREKAGAGRWSDLVRNAQTQPAAVENLASAIALYPVLAVFNFLSRVANRVFASDAGNRANPLSQDIDKPEKASRAMREIPDNGNRAGPAPAVLEDAIRSPQGAEHITLDESFDGSGPGSPTPVGQRAPARRRAT